MNIEKLSLKNYRNCENLAMVLNSKKNLIIGKNAQGKTNILESIYYLSTLKSPRTSNVLDMINFNAEFFNISCSIFKNNTNIDMEVILTSDKKKEVKLNGVKSTQKDFKSVVKTVLFSTTDLMLLRGSPQDRRDWLDGAISQIYPAYDARLTKYNKIRTQKNNFLKEFVENDDLLDVFNQQLIVAGSNIIYLRKKFLSEIEKIAKVKHSTIYSKEEFSQKYISSFINEEVEIEDIANKFKVALEEVKVEEKRRGQSCIGPHRDDIEFYINGQNALKYASQGQQRTIVLALKLSELDMIRDKFGFSPILLLDDVLAELDDVRQNYLLNSINKDTQTVITSVDTLLFDDEFLKDVTIFKIEDGQLVE